jgi:hypothetical protein
MVTKFNYFQKHFHRNTRVQVATAPRSIRPTWLKRGAMSRVCLECSTEIADSWSKLCSDECRATRASNRNTTIAAKFAVLERVLRQERIFWRDDRLIQSVNFYAAIIESGCTYCGTALHGYTGHCLDRIDNSKKHDSWNICACCPLCNAVKSDKFSFDEMALIGSAIKQIRATRLKK